MDQGADLFYLRCWVGIVGAIAVFNGVHCYVDQAYTRKRIYTLQPKEASGLFTRMFGNWVLLAGVIRLVFAFSAVSLSLYLVTFFSFVLAFFHFAFEVFIMRSAALGIATVSPLLISGVSILWMSPVIMQTFHN